MSKPVVVLYAIGVGGKAIPEEGRDTRLREGGGGGAGVGGLQGMSHCAPDLREDSLRAPQEGDTGGRPPGLQVVDVLLAHAEPPGQFGLRHPRCFPQSLEFLWGYHKPIIPREKKARKGSVFASWPLTDGRLMVILKYNRTGEA